MIGIIIWTLGGKVKKLLEVERVRRAEWKKKIETMRNFCLLKGIWLCRHKGHRLFLQDAPQNSSYVYSVSLNDIIWRNQ